MGAYVGKIAVKDGKGSDDRLALLQRRGLPAARRGGAETPPAVMHGAAAPAVRLMGFYVVQCLSGLAQASSLFLVAAGLSIIFGVTRIVNFAHGSFYMVGAYIAVSLAERWPARHRVLGSGRHRGAGDGAAWRGAGDAGAAPDLPAPGAVPAARHLRRRADRAGRRAWRSGGRRTCWGRGRPDFEGVVDILGERFPKYELLLIASGPLVLGLLWLLFHRTRWGTLVRAATQDREMTAALGINQTWLFTIRPVPRLPAGRVWAAPCRSRARRSTCTWTSTSSSKPSSSSWSAAWAASAARFWRRC